MDSSPPENLSGDLKKVLQELIQGRESANKLLRLYNLGNPFGDDQSSVPADDLLIKILASFTESISVLNQPPIEEKFPVVRKSEDSEESSRSTSVLKERRGCYKRRKTAQTWTNITHNLIDDGHAWRKYGRKVILNAKHPRNYYRCTHKFDQGCQATKQVQTTEEDPPRYQTTYHGNHTCRGLHKPPQIILDSTIPKDTSSSVLLSFGSTNYSNFKLNHQPYSHTQELNPTFNHNQSTSTDPLFLLSNSSAFDSSGPVLVSSSGFDHGDMISSSGAYSASTHDHDSHHGFDLDVFGGVGDFDVSQFGFS